MMRMVSIESSVHSFLGIVSSKKPIPDPILEVKVALSIIGLVRGVVQVFQILFTGIPNPSRNVEVRNELARSLSYD